MNEILEQALPFWESLTDKQKEEIRNNMVKTECQKKTQLHFGGGDITLFRLLEGDVSILSAACMLNGMDVELDMEMETDCELYTIPKCVYRKLYDESGIVKDYTMEMISEKFSDIMWLFNQFVFSNVASRIASALLDHKVMERSDSLAITHEALARDAGTAREVVTRILKQFQADGLVKLTRGKVEILNEAGLRKI